MKLTPYGKRVEHALIDRGTTKKWLVEQVRKDTGKFFDHSYLCKILSGTLSTPCIVESINKILELEGEKNEEV